MLIVSRTKQLAVFFFFYQHTMDIFDKIIECALGFNVPSPIINVGWEWWRNLQALSCCHKNNSFCRTLCPRLIYNDLFVS